MVIQLLPWPVVPTLKTFPTISASLGTASSETGSTREEVQVPTNNDGTEPQSQVKGFRWFLVCVAIFSGNIRYGLDTTITADIQASVSETFNNVTQLGWLGVGITLGSTVTILPLGKAYARFDTKWVFIACLTMFAAGSELCGAAPSLDSMIMAECGRALEVPGCTLGTISKSVVIRSLNADGGNSTLNLVTVTSTPKEQPFYVDMTGFAYGTGWILGPIVGGSMADSSATWRWAFYLNLVIFGAMTPTYLLLLPSLLRRTETTFAQKLKSLDWLGSILTAGLYISFTMAFSFGGVIWHWNDGRIIVLVVLFGANTITFGVTQYSSVLTNPIDRLFPCEFLGGPQLILLYVGMACGGAAPFVSIYYISLYFLFVHGDSGTQAAVRLLPFICLYVATILVCGATTWCVRADTAPPHIYGYAILLGFGMATPQAGYAVGPLLGKPDRVAEVIQFLNISQGQSQLIGLTIASAILQSISYSGLKTVLAGTGYPDTEIRDAIAGAKSTVLETATPEPRTRCIDVIVRSINDVWVLVVTAGALYTLCSCLLTRKRFRS